MRLLFVDETGDQKDKEYLGFCVASLDATKYVLLKTETLKILRKLGWSDDVEFKGSCLFSQSKGCKHVSVDDRV